MMQHHTGQYLAEQRHARGLTPQQLAHLVGYRNVDKGGRRILALEREARTVGNLLDRVIEALELDRGYVQSLVADDRRAYAEAWEHWASEAITPELRFRPIAAVWCLTPIPKDLSKDDMIAYAKERATRTGWIHVLVVSRKEEVWCYPDGRTGTVMAEVGGVAGPYSMIGHGSGFVFG